MEQITIHTKTEEEFDITLRLLRKMNRFKKVRFNDSWNRFKEGTCIAWPKNKGNDAYCSPESSCSRYSNFFTFKSFLAHRNGEINGSLYYNGYVRIKFPSPKP